MSSPDPSSPVLEARDLVREFGIFRAVDGISFNLRSGEFLAVFGPNGAGKTSLLRLLSGEILPTSGEVRVLGETFDRGDQSWRLNIGVLSHDSVLYDHLTAEENLRFYGKLFQLPALGERVQERLEEVGLWKRRDSRVGTFSRGMRQRLALARLLSHRPEALLLDEPSANLDRDNTLSLEAVIHDYRRRRRAPALWVSHDSSQRERVADRQLRILHGALSEDPA